MQSTHCKGYFPGRCMCIIDRGAHVHTLLNTYLILAWKSIYILHEVKSVWYINEIFLNTIINAIGILDVYYHMFTKIFDCEFANNVIIRRRYNKFRLFWFSVYSLLTSNLLRKICSQRTRFVYSRGSGIHFMHLKSVLYIYL